MDSKRIITTMATLKEKIKEIVMDILLVDEKELTPRTLLVDDLGMDSLDRVELTMALEEQLLDDTPINERIADEWRTVQDVVDTVTELAEKQERKKAR
jgi:acyl carrier protein